jgi:hypothetical protein
MGAYHQRGEHHGAVRSSASNVCRQLVSPVRVIFDSRARSPLKTAHPLIASVPDTWQCHKETSIAQAVAADPALTESCCLASAVARRNL